MSRPTPLRKSLNWSQVASPALCLTYVLTNSLQLAWVLSFSLVLFLKPFFFSLITRNVVICTKICAIDHYFSWLLRPALHLPSSIKLMCSSSPFLSFLLPTHLLFLSWETLAHFYVAELRLWSPFLSLKSPSVQLWCLSSPSLTKSVDCFTEEYLNCKQGWHGN